MSLAAAPGRSVPAWLRRHWLIITLVALAAVLRVLVMVAYTPAFWYFGDSGEYIDVATAFYPHRSRALGYPIFLAVLRVTGTLVAVVGVQHLAGLALGVGGYALLRRRGLRPALASLAVLPVLFDALQVDLEHFILTETLFTALLAAAIGVLLWWDRPGPAATAVAGLLLAGAWLTRPIALGVAVLLAAYLLLRRVGARSLVAFAVAFAVPFAAVLVWIDGRPSAYGSGSTGLYLYGRTAMIADCDRLVLDADLQELCPATPLAQRSGRADYYLWVYLPPQWRDDPAKEPLLRDFAIEVITQQPGDYLAVVAKESAPYFVPGVDLGPEHRGLAQWWTLPESVGSVPVPWLASPGFARDPADPATAPPATALTKALHWYGLHVRTPALANSLVVVATIAALLLAVRRARRGIAGGWRDAPDAALLTVVSVALLVAQVATSMYEQRYGLPTLPLFCVAAGLAWLALRPATPGRHRGAETAPGSGGGVAAVVVQQGDEVVAVPTLGERPAEPA